MGRRYAGSEHREPTLHAFDATNLGNELYNTNMRVIRDKLNGTQSHAVPTIANGMVYVGTNDCLAAYGEQTGIVPIVTTLLVHP